MSTQTSLPDADSWLANAQPPSSINAASAPTSDVWDKNKAETMDSTAGATPDADAWLAPMQKERYENDVFPTIGRMVTSAAASYVETAAKNNKLSEATGPYALGYMAQVGLESTLPLVKDLAAKIGSFESVKETPGLYPTPIADQLKSQAQKEGRDLTPDEQAQIGAEAGGSIAAYPKMVMAPFSALSPLLDAGVEELKRRGYSDGALAVANTALLYTALKGLHPKEANEGMTNLTHTPEDTFMGLNDPTQPEAQTSALAAQQLAEMAAQKKALPVEPTEEPQAPDIHELARAENPDAVNEAQHLEAQRGVLKDQIDALAEQREKDAHDSMPHSEEDIKAIEDKIAGANKRKAKIYQEQVDTMREENAAHIDEHTSQDTPGMAILRKQQLDLLHKQWDLAPQVSAAYRAAAENMPKAEMPPAETIAPELKPADVVEEKPVASELRPPDTEEHGRIATDLSSRLTRLGRPKDESDAIAQIVATRYQTRAEAFGGKRGTAEEMYQKNMPNIIQGKEAKARAPVLAQKEGGAELQQPAQGKYKFGVRGAKSIIELFKKADASTFMHEMAHHWLEEMMADAKDELATDKMKADAEEVRKWSGLKDEEPISPKEKRDWRRAHEKFARGFERYLIEGTAPTPKLTAIFAKFKDWMTTIYKAVENIPQQGGGITPEIRNIFDRLLTNKPERTTIVSDREPGKMLADIHEADAKNTAPENAATVRNTTETEIDHTAKLYDPEVADVITAAETESVPEQVSGNTGNVSAEESPGEGGTPQEFSPIPASGGAIGSESGGLGEGTGERGGNTKPGSEPAKPNRPISNGAEYIKDGWFRLDKFNTFDDAKEMIRQAAAQNSDFMDARYGEPAYRTAKEIEAANQLLVQAAEAASKIREKFAESGSEADAAAYLRSTQQLAMISNICAEQRADWAHAGHQFQKQVIPDGSANAAQMVMDASGKTLFQLQMEAKLMGGSGLSPKAMGKFAEVARSTKMSKVNSLMLRIIYNSWLSNPITHLKYLTGIGITAIMKDIPQGLFEAGFSALRGAKAGDKFYASEIGAGLYGTFRGVRDTYGAAADAVRDGLTFMEGKQLPGAINAIGHIFGTIKIPKGMTPEAAEMLRDAKNEAMEKNVFAENINPQLAMDKTDSKTPEALAEKAKLPAIYAYLENASKAQEYTSLGATKPGEAFSDMSNAGKLGYALTVSERAISGVHTLGYAMHYGQEIARRSYRSAVDAGMEVGSDEFNTQIAKFTQRPPLEDIQESHEEALKMLLMNRPTYGTFLYNIVQASHTNALAALIMPFAQLGSRLVQFSAEQTPLAWMFKDAREDLSGKNGGMAQDRARAKISTGTAISALVLGMAAEQLITPNWSTDPGKRREQEQMGFKPHALKVGNLYIPLTKFLGGYGPLVGEISDLYNIGHLMNNDQKEKVSAAFLASVATNITDTAFTGGISNIVQAAQDPAHWERYISHMGASVLPYSSLRNEATKWVDPYHRIAHGILEQVQKGTPGLSESLLPERDIWGEPLSSGSESSIGTANNDPVTKWLMKLDYGIAPIQHSIDGVKLTDQQYDDYSKIAGRTAKMMLQRKLNSGIQSESPSQQLMEVKKTVDMARNIARQTIKGYPANSNIIRDSNAAKRLIKG